MPQTRINTGILDGKTKTFKKNNKKLETIKSLKDKISALNDEVATFKEKAQGKEEIEKELSDIKNSIKKEKECMGLVFMNPPSL